MQIKKIQISNIRNHSNTRIEVCDGLNIFHGLNGAGKTSILEAVSIASFSKTFLPTMDKSIIRTGEEFYLVSLKSKNDFDIPYSVKLSYKFGAKKKISSSIGEHLSPKDIIGELPLVILSPDFKSITFGAPADRRLFIDRLLSQASKRYFEEMVKLKRTLKQRNKLLSKIKTSGYIDQGLLEPWNNLLIFTGAEIILRRKKFVSEFIPFFEEVYKQVSKGREKVDLQYAPDGLPDDFPDEDYEKEKIIEALRERMNEKREHEFRRGSTLFGPQKDELRILLNGGAAKEYASQGQHKSLLISLKFAEFNFLKNKRNETPVILLDDIFSELDRERAGMAIELISNAKAQTFITITETENIRMLIPENIASKFFQIKEGEVITEGGPDEI